MVFRTDANPYTCFAEVFYIIEFKIGKHIQWYSQDKEKEVLDLYSLRARYYNPLQGRFLSRDKHTGNYQNELNRYVYTANNPVMFSDPSGMNMSVQGLLNKWRAGTSKAKAYMAKQIAKTWVKGAALGGLGYFLGTLLIDGENGQDALTNFNPIQFGVAVLTGIAFEYAFKFAEGLAEWSIKNLYKNTARVRRAMPQLRLDWRILTFTASGMVAGLIGDLLGAGGDVAEAAYNDIMDNGQLDRFLNTLGDFIEDTLTPSGSAMGTLSGAITALIYNDELATIFGIATDTYFTFRPVE